MPGQYPRIAFGKNLFHCHFQRFQRAKHFNFNYTLVFWEKPTQFQTWRLTSAAKRIILFCCACTQPYKYSIYYIHSYNRHADAVMLSSELGTEC